MAILGAHNTMTFNKPKHWYEYLLLPISRCQYGNINLSKLYNKGVRCFDIRIRVDDEDNIILCHGICDFKGNVYDVLDEINSFDDKCYVRIFPDGFDWETFKEEFIKFCEDIKIKYPLLIFFCADTGGYRINYSGFNYTPTLNQYVGSIADDARWYEKIIPWFYAKRMNKKNLEKNKGDIALFDFL